MCSFHLRNIPESEFNSRPPEILSQGRFWDCEFSLAPAWGVELLCSNLPPVLRCNVTTYRRWFLLSFIFSRWLLHLLLPVISTFSCCCRDGLYLEKTPPLKWTPKWRSLNPSCTSSFFPFLTSTSFLGTRTQLGGLRLTTDYCCVILAPNKSHLYCSLI